MAETYRRLVYRLPAELEDSWAARLGACGSLGLTVLSSTPPDAWTLPDGADDESFRVTPDADGRITVEAYFPGGAEAPAPPKPPVGVEVLEDRPFADSDWMAVWRDSVEPLPVGHRFLVDPREVDEAPAEVPEGRILLRVPARQAFGTGSHETTRLVLEAMEDLTFEGRRVLDVGTGSGILAFAALALGARAVLGFDLDLASALLAGQNVGLNGALPGLAETGAAAPTLLLYAGTLEALGGGAFEVALVNVLPERLRPHLDALAPTLAPGAVALFSGILEERRDEVTKGLVARGFSVLRERRQGEWIALETRLEGRDP